KAHFARRRLDQTQYTPARRRLSAAGFSDEPERLAFVDCEAHVVNRRDVRSPAEQPSASGESLHEMRHLNEGHADNTSPSAPDRPGSRAAAPTCTARTDRDSAG